MCTPESRFSWTSQLECDLATHDRRYILVGHATSVGQWEPPSLSGVSPGIIWYFFTNLRRMEAKLVQKRKDILYTMQFYLSTCPLITRVKKSYWSLVLNRTITLLCLYLGVNFRSFSYNNWLIDYFVLKIAKWLFPTI